MLWKILNIQSCENIFGINITEYVCKLPTEMVISNSLYYNTTIRLQSDYLSRVFAVCILFVCWTNGLEHLFSSGQMREALEILCSRVLWRMHKNLIA